MSHLMFDHSHYAFVVFDEIEALKDYINYMEDTFLDIKQRINVAHDLRLEKERSKTSKEHYSLYKEGSEIIIEDELWSIDDHLKVFRYSLVVTCYSHLELSLNRLCIDTKKRLKSRLSMRDLKGSDLDKALSFLRIVGNVDSNDLKSVWKKILGFREVRNRIVHHNGLFNISHSTLLKEIKLNEYLGPHLPFFTAAKEENFMDPSDRFIYISDRKYFIDFAATIDEFLTSIHKQLADKHN